MAAETKGSSGFARFADICRAHGLKVTQQRFEIYSELAASEEHPDAETVYEKIRGRHHHFICGKCGTSKDFYSADFNSILPPEEVNGFGKAEYVHVEVRGVCNKRRKKN